MGHLSQHLPVSPVSVKLCICKCKFIKMQLLLFKCMYYTYIETIQNSWANVTTGFEILSQVYLIVFKWQHKVLSDSGYVEHMNHLVNILSSLFKTRISDVLPVNQYISEKTHIHTVTLTLLKTGFFFFLSTCFKPFITSPWLPSFGGLYTENSSWNPLLQTMMTKVKLTNSISKSRFF